MVTADMLTCLLPLGFSPPRRPFPAGTLPAGNPVPAGGACVVSNRRDTTRTPRAAQAPRRPVS